MPPIMACTVWRSGRRRCRGGGLLAVGITRTSCARLEALVHVHEPPLPRRREKRSPIAAALRSRFFPQLHLELAAVGGQGGPTVAESHLLAACIAPSPCAPRDVCALPRSRASGFQITTDPARRVRRPQGREPPPTTAAPRAVQPPSSFVHHHAGAPGEVPGASRPRRRSVPRRGRKNSEPSVRTARRRRPGSPPRRRCAAVRQRPSSTRRYPLEVQHQTSSRDDVPCSRPSRRDAGCEPCVSVMRRPGIAAPGAGDVAPPHGGSSDLRSRTTTGTNRGHGDGRRSCPRQSRVCPSRRPRAAPRRPACRSVLKHQHRIVDPTPLPA